MSREIRSSIDAHYNPHTGKLTGRKARQARWGKGKTYVRARDGEKEPVTASPFLGSKVTPKNRNVYMRSQMEYFIERHTADVIRGRENIRKQKDKTEEEIEHEVAIYDMNQVNEEEQLGMAERFARYQANKEIKHYRSWCAGKRHFVFHGEAFPVMTEEFIMKSKEAQEIKKVENGTETTTGTAGSEEPGEQNSGLQPDNNEG